MEEDVRRLYQDKRMSIKQVARAVRIDEKKVSKMVKEMGLTRKNGWAWRRQNFDLSKRKKTYF